jgi:mRNA interferase MazF
VIVKRGEVWWAEFDPAVGSEIQKTRPAVIVSNNLANRYLSRVTLVPLTTKIHRLYPSEALVKIEGRLVKALADQITTADNSRLKGKAPMGILSAVDLLAIDKAITVHLGLNILTHLEKPIV